MIIWRESKQNNWLKLGQKTSDATGYCRGSVERVVTERRSSSIVLP